MSKILYKAPLSLMGTFLVFLLVCGESVENRAANAPAPYGSSHRKPPFNGSIFGKRSNFPPIIIRQQRQPDLASLQTATSGSQASPVENLALLMLQQESLIRAAVDQCMALARQSASVAPAQYLDIEQDPFANVLCGELFGNHGQKIRDLQQQQQHQHQPLDGKWLFQLLSTSDSAEFN